eukprot:TRINITY_DN32184_c0_g1_i1.p1 TRINITY_DN32184_c0_g1~~TRINITY_DN32184_c0_g1_i1.p1  ORF type:complete len:361 (+),score=75.82 TRINITY_DN32184_c0_g1_i1:30-1112(+)
MALRIASCAQGVLLTCALWHAAVAEQKVCQLCEDTANPDCECTDKYPGCREAVTLAQEDKVQGSLEPECALDYEACLEKAYNAAKGHESSYVWEGQRNDALCSCLGQYMECVEDRVAVIQKTDGTLMAPQGCPPIVYSRMCEQLESPLQEATLFPEQTTWKCDACLHPKHPAGSSNHDCVKALHTDIPCSCYFSCPDDYDLGCAGYKCHSISCVLAIASCWVSTGGCSKRDAWYLCLYDPPVVMRDPAGSGQFILTDRYFGCSFDRCYDVIANLVDETGGDWPLWLALYFFVLAAGYGTIFVIHKLGERKRRALLIKHKLCSTVEGGSTMMSSSRHLPKVKKNRENADMQSWRDLRSRQG